MKTLAETILTLAFYLVWLCVWKLGHLSSTAIILLALAQILAAISLLKVK